MQIEELGGSRIKKIYSIGVKHGQKQVFWCEHASRSNTSTLNHHFFASSTIQLRLQRFAICFDDESRSGTPLRLNLVSGIRVPSILIETVA